MPEFYALQERVEDYVESLAFIQLLNKIFAAFESKLPDQGRLYLQFTDFIRVDVLGQLHQRTYR